MKRRLIASLLMIFLPQTALPDEAVVGRASVIDGDTIEIRGKRIRFNGIDAPESRQICKTATGQNYRCGAAAADALHEFLAASRPTQCKILNRDRYKRMVGDCYRADGASVSTWLVKTGHALDWPRYSKGAYAADQQFAQKNRLGVWSGTFERPWEWRNR